MNGGNGLYIYIYDLPTLVTQTVEVQPYIKSLCFQCLHGLD